MKKGYHINYEYIIKQNTGSNLRNLKIGSSRKLSVIDFIEEIIKNKV